MTPKARDHSLDRRARSARVSPCVRLRSPATRSSEVAATARRRHRPRSPPAFGCVHPRAAAPRTAHLGTTRPPCGLGGLSSANVWRPNHPRNAQERSPGNNEARTVVHTTGHSPNTGHEPRCSTTRNATPNDQERVPSTTHQHPSQTCTHMRRDRTGLGVGVVEEMTGRPITVPIALSAWRSFARGFRGGATSAANGARELGVLSHTEPGAAEVRIGSVKAVRCAAARYHVRCRTGIGTALKTHPRATRGVVVIGVSRS